MRHLVLALFLLPAAQSRYIGVYAFHDGTAVDVSYLPDIDSLFAVMIPSGRIGPIAAVSDTEFTLGPTLMRREPVEARFRFEPDGSAVAMNDRRARRVLLPTEEVAFTNGDVRLAGTLTLPPGRGPHPAVVLIHGGGEQTRNFGWIPAFFARLGVAVLAYDKRGCGASTGDWRTASFPDLAADSLAGVDLLRRRADIDSSRIGLYGSSNGGWVAPLAATMAPGRIAFVIARSASGLPERENVIYEAETDLRSNGFGDAAVEAMRALHRRDIAVAAAGGTGWNELRDALAKASGEPWFRFSRLPGQIMEMNDANRPRIAAWIAAQQRAMDPKAVWPRVNVPVLIQLGTADEYVPAAESARILRAALAANRAATVTLYRNGTHPLFESDGGRVPNMATVSRFVPEYLGDLERWIRRYVLPRRAGGPPAGPPPARRR